VSGEPAAKPKRTVHRERDKRLPELIEAATRVFFEKGYRHAPVQEMADQLGILKGSIYHYVSSKEDLLALVLEAAHEHSMGLVAQVTAMDAPPLERLHEHFRLHTLWYLHDPEHVTVFFRDWQYLTGERLESIVEHRRGYDRFLRGLLRECRAAGQLDDHIDEKYISFFLLGALNSAPTWYRRDGRESAETIARTFADLCVSTVLGISALASKDVGSPRAGRPRSLRSSG
jgi:AcrR family transcriptional regulator